MTELGSGLPRASTRRGEIGGVGLPIFAGYLVLDPNPNLRGVQAVQTYRVMRDDEPAASALWFAASNLLRTDLYVEPGGPTKRDAEAAQFLETCLLDMRHSADTYLRQMQGFLWAGWGINELVYKRRGRGSKYNDGRVGWAAWPLRRQDSLYRWGYDIATGRVTAFSQRPAPDYRLRVLPIEKCLHLVADDSEDSPEGRSVFRAMYRQWYFVKNLELMLGISMERFGTGLPVFEIEPNITLTADDKNILEDIAKNLRQNQEAYVITPSGIKFRLEPSPGLDAESYMSAINKMRTWMLSTAMAEFIALGMADSGGSYALGTDKSALFLQALNGFQDRMVAGLNQQAVKRLFRYNDFGALTDLPRLALPAVRKYDVPGLANILSTLKQASMLSWSPEDEEWFRTIAAMPEATAEIEESEPIREEVMPVEQPDDSQVIEDEEIDPAAVDEEEEVVV